MEVTDIKITLRDDERLCGFANIILDDIFIVRGLKIIHGEDRYFVAMPSRRKRDGSFADIAHPITMEFRNKMEQVVLDAYWDVAQEAKPMEMANL